MARLLRLFVFSFLLQCTLGHAQSTDTVVVKTFYFGSKQDSVFKFPADTGSYQKVLMYYTLKCNPKQNPACGQWDYLTYIYLYQKNGSEPDVRYELGRYITPYGINLSMGNGFTWIFDVTDYLPLLHDSVHLSAGNWQELLDVKFLFIKGTPARKPYKVVNMWNGQYLYGQDTPISSFLGPRKVTIDKDAAYTVMKIRPTGHGEDGSNCAEFCAKTHYVYIDKKERWNQLVWRDNCSINPLQPQGGTWLLPRANWCPGAEVQTYEMNVTPFVTPGQEYTFNYDVDAYTTSSSSSGNSTPYYQIESQLIYYGPAAFKLDAAIDRIISPSTDNMYGHLNPVCGHPVIMIKNTGTTALKSLKITYGVQDGVMSTYNWTGNLNFMDTERVILDPPASWAGADTRSFQVTVSEPNGAQDEYAGNNTAYSHVILTPRLDNTIILWTHTNNAASEDAYTVKDQNGKIVYSRSNMQNNTTYRDTMILDHGCYTLHFTDDGQDGLSFFANPGAGNGTLRIFNTKGKVVKTFNPDFGAEILYDFNVEYGLSMEENTVNKSIDVYPNPGRGMFNVDVSLLGAGDCQVKVFSMVGQEVFSEKHNTAGGLIPLDLSKITAGVYVLHVNNGKESFSKQIVIQR